jgi:hypothetical protein
VGGGADETWAEINIRDEMGIQAGQASLRLIDPDLAGHAAKDLKEAQVPVRLRSGQPVHFGFAYGPTARPTASRGRRDRQDDNLEERSACLGVQSRSQRLGKHTP